LPSAAVARVVDGDTVDVTLEGQTVRVRLIGIDTPETVDPRKPVECFGREASAKAHEFLDGQTVFLEDDPSQDSVDRYGRALRYVWLSDGRLFNLEMIAQGYAFEYTYNLPYKYQAQFKQAEREAREQGRGLWAPSACNGAHQPAEEAPGAAATSAPATATPAAPTQPTAPSGGVTITRAPGTVRRGATASVAAHTAPGAACTIIVRYKSGPSKAQGLGPKSANARGDVTWSWKVGTNTTPGAWPVTITCGEESARTEVVVP
jgi:micrococcal nuclease